MRCITCEVEIDPKWAHAIEANVCPFCGKNIMEEHLKNLLSSLKQTMENLKDYQSQLDDWMLSNYNYIKTTSPNIKLYAPKSDPREYVKQHTQSNLDSVDDSVVDSVDDSEIGPEGKVIKKHSEEATNAFFKRAEVIKPNIDGFKSLAEKTQYIKSLAQQIKREGGVSVGASKADLVDLPSDMIDAADPDAIAEYQSLMSGGETVLSSNDGMDDDIPASVLAMARRAGNSGGKNAADLFKLEQQQIKQQQSRENFSSGAKGSFSRSS